MGTPLERDTMSAWARAKRIESRRGRRGAALRDRVFLAAVVSSGFVSGAIFFGCTGPLGTPSETDVDSGVDRDGGIDHDSGAGPALPSSTAWILPSDGATNVTGSDLAVALRAAEGSVASEAIAQLGASISLSDSAESPVSFRVEEEHTDLHPELMYLHVVPSAELSEGWYMLEVTALPEGFAAAPYVAAAIDSAAPLSSAFRVGSAPTLLSVRWCRAETRESMILELSEPLGLTGASAEAAPMPEVSDCALQEPEPAEAQLSYGCPVDEGRSERTVAIGLDVVSASGLRVDLRRTSARELTVVWEEMIPAGSGCRIERL